MSKKFTNHYHLQITGTLEHNIKEIRKIIASEFGINLCKAEVIRLCTEYLINKTLAERNADKKHYALKNALQDMKYIWLQVITIENEIVRNLIKEDLKPADFESKDNYFLCVELRLLNYYLCKIAEIKKAEKISRELRL